MARTILVIDDERNMRWVLERALTKAGYEVVTAARGEQGLQEFARHGIDLVLLDLKMPGMDGMTVLRELRRRSAHLPILLLTAYATVPTAVEALQSGADDYLRKPFDIENVLAAVNRHLAAASKADTHAEGTSSSASQSFPEFVGASLTLQPALARAAAARQMPYPVLVRGEPGTGRRLLARLIHAGTGATQGKTLVELDCANLPRAVLVHELLTEPSVNEGGGRWQQALGGTLLLSNVDALPDDVAGQAMDLLADYLLSRERPHGLRLLLTARTALPAAWASIAAVAFDVELPPLRTRLEDLPLLLAHFTPHAVWERPLLAQLSAYDWPGNVAELQRVAQQAAHLAGNRPVEIAHFPSHVLKTDDQLAGIFVLPPEGVCLDAVEEDLIRQALRMARGNKTQAARLLGLSRATLLYRLDKYAIEDESADNAAA